MAQCKHHEICGRKAEDGDDFCILHSPNPEKDQQAFKQALAEHRQGREGEFNHFVFPGTADFSDAEFGPGADFTDAIFRGTADFRKATFNGDASFVEAEFIQEASFQEAVFAKGVNFNDAHFGKRADFVKAAFVRLISVGATFDGPASFLFATFSEMASWYGTTFGEAATFSYATFREETSFEETKFSGRANFIGAAFSGGSDFRGTFFTDRVDFRHSNFSGRTVFILLRKAGKNSSGSQEAGKIFAGAAVDFRDIVINPLDGLIIRDADLSKCRFLGTDLRKAEITNATWTKIGDRVGVYDEVVPLAADAKRPWAHIERLYRELKQNYEERRDYERASDFHFGEKEMRRRNPETGPILRFFLTAYKWVSGYGERYRPPLFWLGLLWVGSTLGYLGRLGEKADLSALLGWTWWDGLRATLYSFRVMTLLRPDDLVPVGLFAQLIYTADSILGPLLIGLFALALRQRLKR